jgi:hypothetical protein
MYPHILYLQVYDLLLANSSLYSFLYPAVYFLPLGPIQSLAACTQALS